jgi:hypothetical protein
VKKEKRDENLLRQRRENDKKYVRLKRVVEILELLEED